MVAFDQESGSFLVDDEKFTRKDVEKCLSDIAVIIDAPMSMTYDAGLLEFASWFKKNLDAEKTEDGAKCVETVLMRTVSLAKKAEEIGFVLDGQALIYAAALHWIEAAFGVEDMKKVSGELMPPEMTKEFFNI